MEVDIKSSRTEPRGGDGITGPEPRGSEGQQDSRWGGDGHYEEALAGIVKKCKAVSTYETANMVLSTSTRALRKIGCPEELIEVAEDEVAAFFEHRNEADSVARMLQLIMDNHGTINHK